jgi:putative hydrolase of the HAD superfamily
MKSNTKVIWTDFGGVLTPPISETFSQFCASQGLDREELVTAMNSVAKKYTVRDALELIDRPVISEQKWIYELNGYLTKKINVASIADIWFSNRGANLPWIEALTELRSPLVRIAMLSNMVPTWDLHWRKMVNPNKLFEHIVLSFQVGYRKPELGIFEVAERVAGVDKNQCILVDDLEENCQGAILAGWRAVHFKGAMTAKEELLSIIE